MILSILIPCYNEERTILNVLEAVHAVALDSMNVQKEIIIVDDGSSDKTWSILQDAQKRYPALKVFQHAVNQGKGMAIRTSLKHVTGDIIIIQDADMEYSPDDYPAILKVFIEHKAGAVYGSRFLGKTHPEGMKPLFLAGNRFLTFLANALYGAGITDEATCYKAFRADLLKSIPLTCKQFEFCPEVTAKLALRGVKIHEVPVRYLARTALAGKKISWKDAWQATLTLITIRIKHALGLSDRPQA